jgi:hypothetical protein
MLCMCGTGNAIELHAPSFQLDNEIMGLQPSV